MLETTPTGTSPATFMSALRRWAPAVAGPLAAITFLTLGTPYAAQAQDEEPPPRAVPVERAESMRLA